MSPPVGDDPRGSPIDGRTAEPVVVGESLRPSVAGERPPPGVWVAVAGAAVLGVAAFVALSSHRGAQMRETRQAAVARTGAALPASGTVIASAAAPPEVAALEAAARAPAVVVASPATLPAATPPPALFIPTPAPTAVAPAGTAVDLAARRKAPSLVVDLAQTGASGPDSVRTAAGKPAGTIDPGARNRLSGEEQFAERVGSAEPDRVRASMLRNQGAVIAQGAVIPAVLETALNSDLPGYARAVVARDVRSFDGSTVLVPRGSRLVGEYKSGVALGASRAFVIWTRLLRPDGASVQIGSSGTDPLGRAGMAGSVDRHFFQRFGGAVLLSVINGGVAALGRGNSTQVTVGTSSDAAGLGALVGPTNIPPTIKVPQGSPIRVFVARDLDFSSVVNGAAG